MQVLRPYQQAKAMALSFPRVPDLLALTAVLDKRPDASAAPSSCVDGRLALVQGDALTEHMGMERLSSRNLLKQDSLTDMLEELLEGE